MEDILESIKRILKLMEVDLEEKDSNKETEEEVEETEMTEEGEAASTGSAPSSGYPTVGKWETGLTRGPSNPIGNAPRADKVVRGSGNKLV